MKTKPTFIDLFAGAGGLSEGFIKAGFEPIAHVEMDTAACNTLRTRMAYHHLKEIGQPQHYQRYLKGEISRAALHNLVPVNLMKSVINLPIGPDTNEIIQSGIDELLEGRRPDVIIGGPPCQAYSLVGRARSADGMKSDQRNYLYIQYGEFLKKYKPRAFVFENVLGLKSANKGLYLQKMDALFGEIGYKMNVYTVEANHFGVLQNRKRVIIIGTSIREKFEIPNLEKIRIGTQAVVGDLLADLPALQAGNVYERIMPYAQNPSDYLNSSGIRNGLDYVTQHIARPHTDQDKKIYRIAVKKWNAKKERLDYRDLPEELKTHKNRHSFHDRFKVVADNLAYSQTVVAHICKDGHYYIHPDIKQNRSLSVREAARLQSFPDDYYFEGVKEKPSRTAAFKQIGNAVPPLMAQNIAGVLRYLMETS